MTEELFLAVDGSSLLHRAFHALPPMDANGTPTNAVHGFLMMLFKVFNDYQPKYCAVALDEHAPTFRHTMYADYKAGRAKTPDELISQFGLIRDVLNALNIKTFGVPGYEADDILGTIARVNTERGLQTMVLTGDRDALQLIGDKTRVLFTVKGISEAIVFDDEQVFARFKVHSNQITDLKGLMGDSSDNIPGVPGVGEKTAVKLLEEYQTLEEVLAHADEIKGKLGERVRDNRDQAVFSKDLATIRPTVPIDIILDECTTARGGEGIARLNELQLNAVKKQALKLWPAAAQTTTEEIIEEEEPDEPLPDMEMLDTADKIRAFLTETQGQDTALYIGETSLSVATDKRFGQVCLAQDLLSDGLLPDDAWAALDPVLDRPLFVHDAKALWHTLDTLSIRHPQVAFDTCVAQYLLNPQEKSYALRNFAPEHAAGVIRLAVKQKKKLHAQGMDFLLYELEMPLTRVLYDMESAGFAVDTAVLRALGDDYTARCEALKNEIYDLTGVAGFNINSPQQLGKVLFETLGLKAGKKTARGYSTDADTLEAIQDEHPAIRKILEYRTLNKFNSTYIVALQGKTDASGRVHTSFDQTGTSTGRISSSEPNLQNIPVRTAEGREIRRAFIAAPDCVLVDADYSQIELRVLSHMSGDSAMLDAFRRGQDIHRRTASEIYNVPMDDVTSEMRSNCKAVNFGIVYGISEFGLSRNTGLSMREAGDFIRMYFDRYPGVKRFMDDCKKKGRADGFAETLAHRRRYLTELQSPVATVRAFGDRVAMNMPVQGTAADIIKLAMVRVSERLAREIPGARLILQVHDELLIEVPEADADRDAALLKTVMEEVYPLSVPLIAEVKVGKSWYETK